jgi:tRNA pseudouridine55 synthase
MSINGIIVVDKPAGWTSHDVVAKLRGILKEKRIGHGGTLDPMATGVLPVFIGRATRAAEFAENAEKEYIAGLRLGIVTDTQDTTGNTLSTFEASATADQLMAVARRFLGAQKQIPPMYSAIKQNGKKLYELARQGIEVPRPARDVHISEIELLESKENEFLLRIACSKGTYIRTICHDIGQALGCGGVMSSLRRTKAGAFTIGSAHRLDEVQAAVTSGETGKILKPVDTMFSAYKAIALSETETRKCKNGAAIQAGKTPDGTYRLYGPDNEFLALAKMVSNETHIIKGFFTPITP